MEILSAPLTYSSRSAGRYGITGHHGDVNYGGQDRRLARNGVAAAPFQTAMDEAIDGTAPGLRWFEIKSKMALAATAIVRCLQRASLRTPHVRRGKAASLS